MAASPPNSSALEGFLSNDCCFPVQLSVTMVARTVGVVLDLTAARVFMDSPARSVKEVRRQKGDENLIWK